jgi:hypothetical protein
MALEILASAVVQLVVYGAIVAWVTLDAGRPVSFESTVVAIAAATIVGWAAVGGAAGWWLRAELAIPLVVVGSYLALVYPPALEPLWLRHLTGTLGECCLPDAALDPDVVRAMVLLPLGAAVASLCLVQASRRPVFAAASVVVMACATALAVAMVDDLGAEPVAPRSGRVVCAGTPEVCVWPEQSGDLDRILGVVQRTAGRWASHGLAVPTRLSPRPSDLASAGTTSLVLWGDPGRSEVVAAMARGVVPIAPCDGVVLGSIYESRLIASSWLALAGGADPGAVAAGTDPATFEQVERLDALSADARTRWLAAVERADPCTATAVPVPMP